MFVNNYNMNKYIFEIYDKDIIIINDLNGDLKVLLYSLIYNNIILEIDSLEFNINNSFRIIKNNKYDNNLDIIMDNIKNINNIFNNKYIIDNNKYEYYYYKLIRDDIIIIQMGGILDNNINYNEFDIYLLYLIIYIYELLKNNNINMYILYDDIKIINIFNNKLNIKNYYFNNNFLNDKLFYPFLIINNKYFSHCFIPNVKNYDELDILYNNIKNNINNYISFNNENKLNLDMLILSHIHKNDINKKLYNNIPIIFTNLIKNNKLLNVYNFLTINKNNKLMIIIIEI